MSFFEFDQFFFMRNQVLDKPVFQSVLSAMQAAVGPMDYEDVALFLKSGLPLLDRDPCDRLDCYAYQWNLFGSQWEKPWVLHPRGFGENWLPEDQDIPVIPRRIGMTWGSIFSCSQDGRFKDEVFWRGVRSCFSVILLTARS